MSEEPKKKSKAKIMAIAITTGVVVGLLASVGQHFLFGQSNGAVSGGLAGAIAAAVTMNASKKSS